jgi:hypothetical protein
MTEQGRETRLRVEINGEHTVTAQRKKLREVGRGRRLSAPPFEIHHRDNLQRLIGLPMGEIPTRALATLVQNDSKLIDVLYRIGTPTIRLRWGTLPVRGKLTQISLVDANKLCGFGRSKPTNGLLGCRWEAPELVCMEPRGQLSRIAVNEPSKVSKRIVEWRGLPGHVKSLHLRVFVLFDQKSADALNRTDSEEFRKRF